MGTMASQITSFTIVYSTVYSDAHQRKHQSSAPLAFVPRWPVNSPHKWPVTWKMFPYDDVITNDDTLMVQNANISYIPYNTFIPTPKKLTEKLTSEAKVTPPMVCNFQYICIIAFCVLSKPCAVLYAHLEIYKLPAWTRCWWKNQPWMVMVLSSSSPLTSSIFVPGLSPDMPWQMIRRQNITKRKDAGTKIE